MGESTGWAAGRARRRSGEDPAAAGAGWWDLQGALELLPERLRFLVRRLEVNLFLDAGDAGALDGGDPEGGDACLPEDVDLEDAWVAVEAVRTAILEAGRRGAPPEVARRLHERLDREAAGLARAAVGQCISDSRALLRDVSHDLRSPLNSILFLSDTLLGEHSGKLNPVQRRQVGVLYTAAVTLVGLVNDLIDAARLGEGAEISVSHISFSVESVLSDVRSLLGPLAGHRGVELRFHLETVGPRTGDRQLLSRVLINLLTNAIQATEAGGHVEVRVTETKEGCLRLEVRDDGPGADVERLRRLISTDGDPYRAGKTKGWTHGLGLAISSQLVQTAGGTLGVEPASGRGTKFVVELPFRRTE